MFQLSFWKVLQYFTEEGVLTATASIFFKCSCAAIFIKPSLNLSTDRRIRLGLKNGTFFFFFLLLGSEKEWDASKGL